MTGRRGVASLVVLWAMLLLGTLALSFSLAMRTEAQAARNGLDALQAYQRAKSGISRALALLSALPPKTVRGMTIADRGDDGGYSVRLQPEDGKLDVNALGETALKAILEKGGIDREAADALGDAILDWRDPDDVARPHGAEAGDYAGLPQPVRPRNGRIASVEELRFVKGMTPDYFDRFASKVFTAHGGGVQLNVNAAPLEVLEALPGFSPDLARRVAERREASPFASPVEVAAFLAGTGAPPSTLSMLSAVSFSNAVTVVSVGTAPGGARRAVSCLVEIGGSGENPVRMVGWKERVEEGEADGG